MNRLVFLIACFVALSGPPALHAQEAFSADAEREFTTALTQFTEGRFPQASEGFARVVRFFGPNQRTSAAYIMMAKTQLRLNAPLDAARTLHQFTSSYPSSSYTPDADYTMGLVYLKVQRYDDAGHAFLDAWRSNS